MQYQPHWRITILASIIFHVVILFAVSSAWSNMKAEPKEQEVQETEWVDVEVAEKSPAVEEVTPVEEILPEDSPPAFEFPPIEIPPIPEPVVKEEPPPEPVKPPVEQPKPPVEQPKPEENKPPAEKNKPSEEEKPDDDSKGKLKVLTKVFPKDVVNQLIESGIVKERPILNGGKIVLAITIGTNGKIKTIEIRRGGGNDERGNIINLVSEAAASGWVFEPFVDEEGNPKEMKTQIEFKPEDF